MRTLSKLAAPWILGALAACGAGPGSPSDDAPGDDDGGGGGDGCEIAAACRDGRISVTTSALAHEFIAGHSASASTTKLDVIAAATTPWRLTSSAPWIGVPAETRMGSGEASVILDASGLGVGQATGTVTVANAADPSRAVTLVVTATVTAPTFSVSPAGLILGGDDGLEMVAGQPLQISLGTGTTAHPWSLTLTTDAGGAWLRASAASGMASGTPATIEINADRALVAPGRYTGAVRVEAVVRGAQLSRSIPITFHKEAHRLHVSSLGAAFSSFPGRGVLTRTLQVQSSQGRTDVPWTAQSDQSWLSVTPAGMTGGALALAASPAGLPSGQYLARVTVSAAGAAGSNPILDQQIVRVGLRVGAADPQSLDVNADITAAVANPVEPYVYTNNAGADITVYDVYTGAVVRTFASAVGRAGRMAVSSDGAILFVHDDLNLRAVALDAETGAELRRYPWNPSYTGGIAYARPGAYPVLISGGRVFDVATGAPYPDGSDTGWTRGLMVFGVDPASRYVFVQDSTGTAYGLSRYATSYTALRDSPFVGRPSGYIFDSHGAAGLCVSADGARVYTTSQVGYDFAAFSTTNLQQLQTLPAEAYPSGVACGWNGLFLGADSSTVWVRRPNGTLVTRIFASFNVRRGTLALSGDGTRVAIATEGVSSRPPALDLRSAPAP